MTSMDLEHVVGSGWYVKKVYGLMSKAYIKSQILLFRSHKKTIIKNFISNIS